MVAQTDDIDPRGVLDTNLSSSKSGGRDAFLATTSLGRVSTGRTGQSDRFYARRSS